MKGYTRDDLLVDPEWIEEHLNDSDVRLIDCRPEEAYRQGHIHELSGFLSHLSPTTPILCG